MFTKKSVLTYESYQFYPQWGFYISRTAARLQTEKLIRFSHLVTNWWFEFYVAVLVVVRQLPLFASSASQAILCQTFDKVQFIKLKYWTMNKINFQFHDFGDLLINFCRQHLFLTLNAAHSDHLVGLQFVTLHQRSSISPLRRTQLFPIHLS